MPRKPMEANSRMAFRIPPEEKALIMRAVALQRTSLTDFVVRNAVAAARSVIERAERVHLSERDSLLVLDVLENPPEPEAKLLRAARDLPKTR